MSAHDMLVWALALALPLGGVLIFAGWMLLGSAVIAGPLFAAWLVNRQ